MALATNGSGPHLLERKLALAGGPTASAHELDGLEAVEDELDGDGGEDEAEDAAEDLDASAAEAPASGFKGPVWRSVR